MLVLFAVISSAQPLYAVTRQYDSKAHDDATSKLINKVLEAQITEAMPVVSADLQVHSIYDAFILALEIMQEYPLIEDVEYPMMAPDQSIIIIPYFPKEQPDNLRFVSLYRHRQPRGIAIYNSDGASFNEFTNERYKMHFHDVHGQKSVQWRSKDERTATMHTPLEKKLVSKYNSMRCTYLGD